MSFASVVIMPLSIIQIVSEAADSLVTSRDRSEPPKTVAGAATAKRYLQCELESANALLMLSDHSEQQTKKKRMSTADRMQFFRLAAPKKKLAEEETRKKLPVASSKPESKKTVSKSAIIDLTVSPAESDTDDEKDEHAEWSMELPNTIAGPKKDDQNDNDNWRKLRALLRGKNRQIRDFGFAISSKKNVMISAAHRTSSCQGSYMYRYRKIDNIYVLTETVPHTCKPKRK